MRWGGCFLAGIAAALGACAGAPPRAAEVARAHGVEAELRRAEAELRQAEGGGAREAPGAVLYLSYAERELAEAQAHARVRDAEGARGWAMRARADAALAAMIAAEAAAYGAAQRSDEQASELEAIIEAPLRAAPAPARTGRASP
jgi:hypothetical protein